MVDHSRTIEADFSHLPNLRHITISQFAIKQGVLTTLNPRVRTVDLTNLNYTSTVSLSMVLKKELFHLSKSLRVLRIGYKSIFHSPIITIDSDSFQHFSSLEVLEVQNIRISGNNEFVFTLKVLPQTITHYVENCSILPDFSNCPHLHELKLIDFLAVTYNQLAPLEVKSLFSEYPNDPKLLKIRKSEEKLRVFQLQYGVNVLSGLMTKNIFQKTPNLRRLVLHDYVLNSRPKKIEKIRYYFDVSLLPERIEYLQLRGTIGFGFYGSNRENRNGLKELVVLSNDCFGDEMLKKITDTLKSSLNRLTIRGCKFLSRDELIKQFQRYENLQYLRTDILYHGDFKTANCITVLERRKDRDFD